MYKNTWIFLSMIIVIIMVVFTTIHYFDSTLKRDSMELNLVIDEIIKMEESEEKISSECEKLVKTWEDKAKEWSFIIHHSTIEKIETAFMSFKEYAIHGNIQMKISEGEKLKNLLKITSQQDELSLSNVL